VAEAPKAFYDYLATLEAGMNSGLDPLLLERNQAAFLANMTVRDGFASTRPPVTRRLTITYPSTDIQTAVEQGLWQGCGYYNPDSGPQSLFASISGRIFQFLIVDNGVTVTERTIVGDANPATATQAWIWQSENYLIFQDGVSLPLFWDGTTMRRSYGPSVLLATVTGATPGTPPAIGDTVALTLAAPWPGPYNVPVLFNGEYYQPIATTGGYVVDLTSLYSVGGTAINVNDAVNIIPGYAGVVANPIALPAGTYFDYNTYSFVITLTAPYTGVVDPFITALGCRVIIFGKTWFVAAAAGNTITVLSGQPGFLPASLNSGTIIQFVSAAPPNVLVGFNTIADTDPGIGGTVQLTLTQAYNGPAGAIVYIGAAQYTITAVAAPPGVASVDLINLTDTSITAYVFTNPSDQILSVPELPAGRMGCYGLGQNWMALVDGLSFICSDASRGPSGTPANNYRDAVLKTTDLSFRGGNFAVPGAGNPITSMTFMANLDTALGQGSLEVGTAVFMGSVQAPFDFLNPNSESPLLTYSLIDQGPLGQNSTIRVNSDIYFRSTFGINTLILARRDFGSPGNTPISDEMVRVLNADDERLLTYGSSINFDNRFLTTVSPQATSQGVMHAGLIVQNQDPVSGARGKQPAVWDGLWTGLNVLQLVSGMFSEKPRAFAFTFNVTESKIELYEILTSANPLYSDNEDTPITQVFETAALFRDDVKPRYQMVSLRNGEFSLSNVQGPVFIRVYYKSDQSCWVPWHSFGICASVDSEPQYFPRLSLGEPTSDYCDAIVNSPLRDGYTYQFRFEITGKCRFVHARFMTVPIPTPQFRPPICEPIGTCRDRDCEAITGVAPFSDLTIYNLQDRLYFNGTPLTFIEECPTGYYCPPGLFPRTFTYPPGTFTIYLPPCCTGFPIVLTKQGCESSVSVTLPATATTAQIQAAGADVIAQIAAQQARCDAISIAGPRLPTLITLSDLDSPTCADAVFIDTITASGGTSPYTFSSPDLPGWLTPSSTPTTTTLNGTPPAIGSYVFTLVATSSGGYGQRTYTLVVVGIATASLANGTEDAAYSETLTAPSITGTLTWSVIAGTLPTGLSLDSGTGEIYGTPTVAETATFTVQVTNGTVTCSKEFDLEIEASALTCPAIISTIINGASDGVLTAAKDTTLGRVLFINQAGPTTFIYNSATEALVNSYAANGGPGCYFSSTDKFVIPVGGYSLVDAATGVAGITIGTNSDCRLYTTVDVPNQIAYAIGDNGANIRVTQVDAATETLAFVLNVGSSGNTFKQIAYCESPSCIFTAIDDGSLNGPLTRISLPAGPVTTIEVGPLGYGSYLNGAVYVPATGKVYMTFVKDDAVNYNQQLWEINPATMAVDYVWDSGALATGVTAEVDYNPSNGGLYVAFRDAGQIWTINPLDRSVICTTASAAGFLSVDQATDRIFAKGTPANISVLH